MEQLPWGIKSEGFDSLYNLHKDTISNGRCVGVNEKALNGHNSYCILKEVKKVKKIQYRLMAVYLQHK